MAVQFNPFTGKFDLVGDSIGTPSSTTDNAIVTWDSTTGQAIAQPTSNIPTISDTGIASFPEDDFIDCERIGGSSSVTGDRATALGCQATATQDSIALGERAQTTTSRSQIALGATTLASGFGASAFGSASVASGSNSVAIGIGADATQLGSFAMGAISQSTASYGISLGFSSNVAHSGSVAIGREAVTKATKQLVLGGRFGVIQDYWFGMNTDGTTTSQYTGDYNFNFGMYSTAETDANAVNFNLYSPAGNGTGTGGHIRFYVAPAGTTGSTRNSHELALEITDDKETKLSTSFYAPIETVTASSHSPSSDEYTILCDASSNAITVNLPSASSSNKRILNIKKIDSSANKITIDANSSEQIDGALTAEIVAQYESLTIQCDGSNWWII